MAYIPFHDERTWVPSPADAAAALLRRVRRGWAVRRERHEIERMLGFEAELLADIVVSRDDVVQALTTREPSRALERAARARRSLPRRTPSP